MEKETEEKEMNRLNNIFSNINHSIPDEDEKCPFFRICPKLRTPEMKDKAWGFCLYQPNFQEECEQFKELWRFWVKVPVTFSFEGKILYKGRLMGR